MTVSIMLNDRPIAGIRSATPEERRVGFFWIDPRDLLALLGGWSASGKFLRPIAETLPVDAQPLGVHYDWQREAFTVLVTHPSFAVVQPGEPIPWVARLLVELRDAPVEDTPAIREVGS